MVTPHQGFRFHSAGGQTTSRLADAVVGQPTALDTLTLGARMVFGSPPAQGGTPYLGVRAAYVRAERDRRGEIAERADTPEVAATQLRRALEAEVAHALHGVDRAAVLTGGGLDSSALLALAHRWGREHGVSVFGVALDFGGPGDDRPYLAALERHLDCEVLRVRPEEAAARIDLFLRGVDAAPFTWPSGGMEVEAFTRARAHGATVVLTGVGADELLDGDPRSLARAALRAPRVAVESARRMRGFDRPRRPAAQWLARPLVTALLPDRVRRWRARRATPPTPSWAGRAFVESMRAGELARERAASEAAAPMWDPPHHEHLAWLRHQQESAGGIACRQPFLEAGLRELVARFDPAWLLHGAIRRGLFRAAVKDLLPVAIVEREDKAGFECGLLRFLAASGGVDALRPLASGRELAALGLVDSRRLLDAFAAFEHALGDGEHWGNVWPVLAVEAFLRARRGGQS